MSWYKEKTTGKYWWGKGFFTGTYDWNDDNDIYTDTVMNLFELDGNAYWQIHKYDLDMFEEVPEAKVKEYLLNILNDYFIDCGEYWCNPSYTNNNHYGDRNFIKGGYCIYNNERTAAIEKEIDYQFNKRFAK